jgi:hypothetical protein
MSDPDPYYLRRLTPGRAFLNAIRRRVLLWHCSRPRKQPMEKALRHSDTADTSKVSQRPATRDVS